MILIEFSSSKPNLSPVVSNVDHDNNSSPFNLNAIDDISDPVSDIHHEPMVKMKTIPMEEYKRLVDISIDLIKAKQVIVKLTKANKRKDALITKLRTEIEHTGTEHLTEVSVLGKFQIWLF